MTTILEAEFGSDSEDSDYVLSEVSSDEESPLTSNKEKKRREKMLERVNLMFDDMVRASDVSYRHPELGEKDDFMLQFQRKSPPTPKIRTPQSFQDYLDKNISRVFQMSPRFDIREFKEKCHQTPNSEKLEMVKHAVAVKDAEPATIKTTYKFAGTTYEVVDKVSKKSRKYSNYLKRKEKELGGEFGYLDELYSKLGPAPTLSAVSKSELDWTRYKDELNLDSDLKKSYHHLKEQEFLQRTTWNQYQRELQARK